MDVRINGKYVPAAEEFLGGSKDDCSNTNLVHLRTQEPVFTPLETCIYF